MEGEITESLLLWEVDCQTRGAAHLTRLELEQAVLRPSTTPAAIEVAIVATSLSIDAAGEPRVDDIPAKRLLH
jgi:hypothetical protein